MILGAALALSCAARWIDAAEITAAAPQLDPAAPLTPAVAAQLSQSANRPVIVLMKNRLSGAGAANDQAPLMRELGQVNAARIKPFRTVNALAATVSEGEIARLKANPAVAAVVPDVLIRRAPRKANAAALAASAPNARTSLSPNVIPGACGVRQHDAQRDHEALPPGSDQ